MIKKFAEFEGESTSLTLGEVKKWIDSLPVEFLAYTVVNAEEGEIEGTENNYRLDKPIIALNVDEESQEILFLTSPPQD